MSDNKERIVFIDALKGFAILCVVLGHIVDGYYRSGMYSEENQILWTMFVIIYIFHMGLFFVISGYLYGEVYINNKIKKEKIYRQIKRLLYVYVFWCFLMWCFKLVMGKWANNSVNIWDIFLIPVKSIEPYWYLYVLIIYYLIFSIEKVYRRKWQIILCTTGIIALISDWLPQVQWFEITKLLYYGFFFYLGVCVAKKYIKLNAKVIPAGLIAGALIIINYPCQINTLRGTNIVCAFGIVMVIFWFFENNEKLWRKCNLLTICGKYSLEIYVMHCFLTAFLRHILYKMNIANIYINICINLVVSVFIPIFVSYYAKKIKLYDIMFKGIRFGRTNL